MSLEEKLAAIREASAKRIPPERLAVMHGATEQLRNSGILGRVIKPGARAGFHAERSEWHARGAVGADRARSRSDECVPRLLVTVLPA
jgi:hypothetical protein